jgi:hypothetical protein
LYPAFEMLRWSFRALAEGRYPQERHDGQELDEGRDALDGKYFGFKAIILDATGD